MIDAALVPLVPEILGSYKIVVTCKVDDWSLNYLIKLYDLEYTVFNNTQGNYE